MFTMYARISSLSLIRLLLLMILVTGFQWSEEANAGAVGVVSGRVLDLSGVAVPNAVVQLLSSGGKRAGETKSKPLTGDFSFSDVETGTYQLVVKTSPNASPSIASVYV